VLTCSFVSQIFGYALANEETSSESYLKAMIRFLLSASLV
jgi:hypothetical protein